MYHMFHHHTYPRHKEGCNCWRRVPTQRTKKRARASAAATPRYQLPCAGQPMFSHLNVPHLWLSGGLASTETAHSQPFLIFIADIIVRTLSLPQLPAMSINTWDKLAKAQRDYPKPRYASAVVDKASKKDPKNPYLIVSTMMGLRCVLC
jgi:hypothetical protein